MYPYLGAQKALARNGHLDGSQAATDDNPGILFLG